MAFNIDSSIQLIHPAYSPMEVSVSDPSANYIDVFCRIMDSSEITISERTVRLISTAATVDLQGIVQPSFQSDASVEPYLRILKVWGITWLTDSSTEKYLDQFYIFNGTDNAGNWNFADYMMDGSVHDVKFLNNYNADINILYENSNPRLYLFRGIFGNSKGEYQCSFPTFNVVVDGSTFVLDFWSTTGYAEIIPFPVDPSSLITLGVDKLNANTKSFTINPSQNTGNTWMKTINFISEDERFPSHKVSWIDSIGCINSFVFTLAKTNSVDITRGIFNNNGVLRQYNTQCKDKYTLTSNWITEKESLALKDLWYSPSVMVDGQYAVISNKQVKIQKRKDVKLINYEMDYELSNEYRVQII